MTLLYFAVLLAVIVTGFVIVAKQRTGTGDANAERLKVENAELKAESKKFLEQIGTLRTQTEQE